MISYELAKQLEERGFEKIVIGKGWRDEPAIICNPTLSELIEALDKSGDFYSLLRYQVWKCCRYPKTAGEDFHDPDWATGETPEEAVAKLWLKLNKKNDKNKSPLL